MRNAVLWATIGFSGLIACGGSGAGPAGPSPGTSLSGSYSVLHRFSVSGISIDCSGELTIPTGGGSAFTGTMGVSTCLDQAAFSFPIEGTLGGGNEISFRPSGNFTLQDVFEAQGCSVVAADESFLGTFAGTLIQASADATVQNCPGIPGTVLFVWNITATKNVG